MVQLAAASWVSGTSSNDPNGDWTDDANVYDGNTATYASNNPFGTGWNSFIEINLSSVIYCDRIRVYSDFGYGVVDEVDIDVYDDDLGSWVDGYQGVIADAAWDTVTFSGRNITAARFRYHYTGTGFIFWLYELEFWEATPVSAPSVQTRAATSEDKGSGILHGEVLDDGGEPCEYRFEYGQTISYGATTNWISGVISGDTFGYFIGGLTENETYHYRVQLKNSAATVNGTDRYFTTIDPQTGWLAPTGNSDGSSSWEDELNAYDDETLSYARSYSNIGDPQWGEFINFTHESAISSNKVRLYARGDTGSGDRVDQCDVDIYLDGSWQDVYQGALPHKSWLECSFTTGSVTEARVRFRKTNQNAGLYFELYEFDFYKVFLGAQDQTPNVTINANMEIVWVDDLLLESGESTHNCIIQRKMDDIYLAKIKLDQSEIGIDYTEDYTGIIASKNSAGLPYMSVSTDAGSFGEYVNNNPPRSIMMEFNFLVDRHPLITVDTGSGYRTISQWGGNEKSGLAAEYSGRFVSYNYNETLKKLTFKVERFTTYSVGVVSTVDFTDKQASINLGQTMTVTINILDTNVEGVEGAPVTISILSGYGSLNTTNVTTNASGYAYVQFTSSITTSGNTVLAAYCDGVTSSSTMNIETLDFRDREWNVWSYSGTLSGVSADVSIATVNLSSAFILAPAGHMSAGCGSGGGGQNADDVLIRVHFNGSDQVTVERGGNNGSSDYTFYVIEEATGQDISVQSGTTSFQNNTDTAETVSLSGITSTNQCVVFLTASSDDNSNNNYNEACVQGWVDSGGNLQLQRSAGGSIATVDWFVVEFSSSWNIQQGSATNANNSDTQAISGVTATQSFVYTNWQADSNGLAQISVRTALNTAGNQLTFSRSTGTGSCTLQWYVISHDTAIYVQHGSSSAGTNDNNLTAVISPVDSGKSFPMSFNDCSGTGTAFPRPYWLAEITDSSTLQWYRSRTGQPSNFDWQVIEFASATPDVVSTVSFTFTTYNMFVSSTTDICVEVVYQDGKYAKGLLVTISIVSGGGSLLETRVTTNAYGQACTVFTAGSATGNTVFQAECLTINSQQATIRVTNPRAIWKSYSYSGTMTAVSTMDVQITPVIDTDRAFILAAGGHMSAGVGDGDLQQNADEVLVSARFLDDQTVRLTRGTNAGNSIYSFYVIEEQKGLDIFVTSGYTSFDNTTDTDKTIPLSSIGDNDQTVVFLTVHNNDTGRGNYNEAQVRAWVDNSNNLQLRRNAGNSITTVAWFVVEFKEDWQVEQGDHSMNSAASIQQINTVNLEETILFMNWQVDTNGLAQTSPRAAINSAGNQIDFNRQTATGTCTVRWFLIKNSNIRVQRGQDTGVNADLQESQDFSGVKDLRKAVPLSFNDCTGVGDYFPRAYWTLLLSDSDTLQWDRAFSGQTSIFDWQVIDLPLAPPEVTINSIVSPTTDPGIDIAGDVRSDAVSLSILCAGALVSNISIIGSSWAARVSFYAGTGNYTITVNALDQYGKKGETDTATVNFTGNCTLMLTRNYTVQAPADYINNGGGITDPVPGAEIIYFIDYFNPGEITINNVEIIDQINTANLSYRPGTATSDYTATINFKHSPLGSWDDQETLPVKSIRWQLQLPVAPAGSGRVTYNTTIN